MRRIERAGPGMDPGWTDATIRRGVAEMDRKRRRRRAARTGLTMLAVCMVGFAGARWLQTGAPALTVGVGGENPGQAPPPAAPAAAKPITLADGSLVIPLDAACEVAVARESAQRVEVQLARGRSRFQVTPAPTRVFVVQAGAVAISVLGTVFNVERVADRVGVSVERGRVRVDWEGGSRLLAVGESGWFPPLGAATPAPAVVLEATPPAVAASPVRSSPRSVPPSPEPSVAPATAVAATHVSSAIEPASPEQLLQAADGARLAGRTDEAAALLGRVVADHARDPLAHVAAFTLGRLYLSAPGRAADAARAFAQARALAPAGAFAEDALAREAESWAKAGDAAQASACAREYLQLYPDGRRLATVKAFGGIE